MHPHDDGLITARLHPLSQRVSPIVLSIIIMQGPECPVTDNRIRCKNCSWEQRMRMRRVASQNFKLINNNTELAVQEEGRGNTREPFL